MVYYVEFECQRSTLSSMAVKQSPCWANTKASALFIYPRLPFASDIKLKLEAMLPIAIPFAKTGLNLGDLNDRVNRLFCRLPSPQCTKTWWTVKSLVGGASTSESVSDVDACPTDTHLWPTGLPALLKFFANNLFCETEKKTKNFCICKAAAWLPKQRRPRRRPQVGSLAEVTELKNSPAEETMQQWPAIKAPKRSPSKEGRSRRGADTHFWRLISTAHLLNPSGQDSRPKSSIVFLELKRKGRSKSCHCHLDWCVQIHSMQTISIIFIYLYFIKKKKRM